MRTVKLFLKTALFLSVIILCAMMSVSALESFTISSYDIQMDVANDNTYQITETIKVDYSVPLHGIFRTIPLKTYNNNRASVQDVSVQGAPYSLSSENNALTIRIGDPDKFAGSSETYVISYKYAIGDDRLSKMDELYMNLIGTNWDTYISGVTFDITMPYDFDQTKLNFTYGAFGSEDNSLVEYVITGNAIRGSLKKTLGPTEALTVALELPEGYYDNVVIVRTIADFLIDYYPAIFAGLLLLAFVIWMGLGKNARIFPPVEFNPPEGMTSADIGYVYDGVVNPYDITSLIIYWAGRGSLAINEETVSTVFSKKKQYKFEKLKELPPDAKDYERVMFDDMFNVYGNGQFVDMTDLRNKFYKTVKKVKSSIINNYAGGSATRVFSASGPFCKVILRFLSYAAAYMTMLVLYMRGTNDIFEDAFIPVLLFAIALYIPVKMLSDAIYNWKSNELAKKIGSVITTAIWLGVYLYTISYFVQFRGFELFSLIGFISAFAIMHLAKYCVKRTPLGNESYSRLVGFRNFMVSVEQDRIKVLAEESPDYFYKTLPYAIAFGIAPKWAAKFEGITTEPPDWYRNGQYPGLFNTIIFTHMLNDGINDMSAAMTSSPSQSSGGMGGSFGGGFSGGGSGGGGGGGW